MQAALPSGRLLAAVRLLLGMVQPVCCCMPVSNVPKPFHPALRLALECAAFGGPKPLCCSPASTLTLDRSTLQVYGGLVHMDFDSSYMQQHGHGRWDTCSRAC